MTRPSFLHLSHETLLLTSRTLVAGESTKTVEVVAVFAVFAEIDGRKLYARLGYPSMYAFCVAEYGMAEDSAFKRIRAARAARRFPAILDGLADGRLHLSAVVLLAPHLKPENFEELVSAASHKTRAKVERMLADRFPLPDVASRVKEVSSCSQAVTVGQLAPGPVGSEATGFGATFATGPDRPRLKPLGVGRFSVQFTMDEAAHDDPVRAQELMSHQLPSGDVATVFAVALRELNRKLEKQKFAVTSMPRAGAESSEDPRHIPAAVKRAVMDRDGGRCAFVGDNGRRCSSRKFIEFDHMDELALGGRASISRIRLLCRTHNQYEAERRFGPEFMRRKREGAIEERAAAKMMKKAVVEPLPSFTRAPVGAVPATDVATLAPGPVGNKGAQSSGPAGGDQDIFLILRRLGYRADEARRGAAACAHIPDASLDQRFRVALASFPLRGTRTAAPINDCLGHPPMAPA